MAVKYRTFLLVMLFLPIAVFSGTWTDVEIEKMELSYNLPEKFGKTTLSFGFLDNQLTFIAASYQDVKVQAESSLLSGIFEPNWNSFNVSYEDVEGDGFIEWFSFCFYEKHFLYEKELPRYITYSLYAEEFYREIITENDLLRRCEPNRTYLIHDR